jgi:outer membrane protein OmpA-like peptidoglycan-associated protein
MKRAWVIAMSIGMMMISGGCLASHKYVNKTVKTSTDQLSSQVNTRIDQTNGRVDTLDGEVKETRDSVDLVNRRVAGVDERVSVVDTRVSTVDGRVTTVDNKVGRVDNKVTAVDEKVTVVDGKVASLDNKTTQQLNTIKEDVNVVDEKAEKTDKGLNLLDEKFGNRNNLTVSAERAVQFAFDSSKLDKASIALLDEMAAKLMEDRDAIIVLEGRTDSTGDRDYNIALGERRVEQVRRYLAVDKSIPVYRIHQVSFGAARPIAENNSAEGRQKNRSVTVMVLVPSSTASAAAGDRSGQLP